MLAARLSMSRSSEPIVAWRAAFDAFLCGVDRYSGQNFDHRKTWIRHRLEQLAGIMAIDVLSFAVLSNHLHVMPRIRPDIAAAWSDEEVARLIRSLLSVEADREGAATTEPHVKLRVAGNIRHEVAEGDGSVLARQIPENA
ncbi:MAG TPA: hypothetical protein VF306_02185 [Pirellulales bacterium]